MKTATEFFLRWHRFAMQLLGAGAFGMLIGCLQHHYFGPAVVNAFTVTCVVTFLWRTK